MSKNEHETVVKHWEIPIPPELDKIDIGMRRVGDFDGDHHEMTFTGTGVELCVMAVEMLRAAGAKNVSVEELP